jgi:hypothetical protein
LLPFLCPVKLTVQGTANDLSIPGPSGRLIIGTTAPYGQLPTPSQMIVRTLYELAVNHRPIGITAETSQLLLIHETDGADSIV